MFSWLTFIHIILNSNNIWYKPKGKPDSMVFVTGYCLVLTSECEALCCVLWSLVLQPPFSRELRNSKRSLIKCHFPSSIISCYYVLFTQSAPPHISCQFILLVVFVVLPSASFLKLLDVNGILLWKFYLSLLQGLLGAKFWHF